MKLLATGVFAATALAAASASAQTPPPPLNHGPAITGVCVYSAPVVLSTSTAGQSLRQGLQRLAGEVDGELAPYQTSMQAEATALEQGQATIPQAELQQRGQALEQRFREYQQLRQTRQGELRYTELAQTQTIIEAARPIVTALYQERGCSILISEESVLAFNPAMDLTPIAIQRLNQQLPSLPAFNRMPVPVQQQQ